MLNAAPVSYEGNYFYGEANSPNFLFVNIACLGGEVRIQDCIEKQTGTCNSGAVGIKCERKYYLLSK